MSFTLVAMKRARGYEALLRNMKNEKHALRFMAAMPPLHRSRKASASYSPKANASLTTMWFYGIITKTAVILWLTI